MVGGVGGWMRDGRVAVMDVDVEDGCRDSPLEV